MNSRPAWSPGRAAAKACSPSFVAGLTLPSTNTPVSCSSVWPGSDAAIRLAAAFKKLIRFSRVELLTQEAPAGPDCTPMSGQQGFDITVTRVFHPVGSTAVARKQDFHTHYKTEPILHCVPADRLTTRYFARRYYAQGVSDELLFADRREPISWRGRIGRARYALAGALWVFRDVLRRRSTFDGWFNLHYWAGRSPICKCGFVKLWWWGEKGAPEESQHIFDIYATSHALHGIRDTAHVFTIVSRHCRPPRLLFA